MAADAPELSAQERAGKAFPVSWDQFHRDCRALTWRLNEARLRMARIPDGAELIQSATILAPGFKIGNVIVMAGVPSIMQAMMDIVAPKLKSGVRMLSESVRANAREGDIGGPLREIAHAHPDTVIGSYPFQDEDKKPNTNLVVRSRDPDKLTAAMTAVKEMLAGLKLVR